MDGSILYLCTKCHLTCDEPQCPRCALKADLARMQPVFDAAMEHYNIWDYGSADEIRVATLALDAAVRKLDR